MNRKFLAGLAAAIIGVAGSAQALTTITQDSSANADALVTPVDAMTTDIDLSWTTGQSSAYVTFQADGDGVLYLSGYTGAALSTHYSGVMLYEDGVNQTTAQTNACTSSFVLMPIRGACTLVTNDPAANSSTVQPSATTPFYTLTAGSIYTVGFWEGATPENGTVSFQAVESISAVPLPAGGALLVGALGAIGALRRRRKAA